MASSETKPRELLTPREILTPEELSYWQSSTG